MATNDRRGNGEGSKPIQRKDGRYQIALRYTGPDGSPVRKTFTAATEKDVRAKVRAAQRRIDGGFHAVDSRSTVAAVAEQWMAGPMLARNLRASSIVGYSSATRAHICDTILGRTPLANLRPANVESWLLVELPARGLSANSQRRAFGVLKMILDMAVRDGLIANNPTAQVRRPAPAESKATYLEPSQVRDLIDAFDSPNYRAMTETLAWTGIRVGEAIALRWSDIDFAASTIRVERTLTHDLNSRPTFGPVKTAKGRRTIHMLPELATSLRSQKARQNEVRLRTPGFNPDGMVFTSSTGTPVRKGSYWGVFHRAAVAAGVVAHPHLLRHSAISHMLMAGVPLKVASEIAGHATISITADIYGHVAPEVAADAIGLLGKALGR